MFWIAYAITEVACIVGCIYLVMHGHPYWAFLVLISTSWSLMRSKSE